MTQPDLLELLRTRFGHDQFRPGQERLIRDVLDARDALAVLPTGGGKSLVYQLAAQALPGVTVVVSPLLALMKDQVDSLHARGIGVSVISSLQNDHETAAYLRNLTAGRAHLLYVTPERFENDEFMVELKRLHVSLLVVDEAHSISEWGHSFRPAYLALGTAAELLGRPPLLALTATASPWIRREIVERLRLHEPDIVVTGVDRPNLCFEVLRVEEEREDRGVLRALLDEPLSGSGIIYTATTKAAEATAGWLQEWGITADVYHGQRRKSDRERVQAGFMAGELRVIAATNAFGMGIDKPDVRFVIHRDIPSSIEAYYQEAGRAGRDGAPARCTLIYRPGDLGRAAFLNGGGELTRDEVRLARRGLRRRRAGTVSEMARASRLGRGDFLRLVDLLEQQGVLEHRRGRLQLLVDDFDADAVPLDGEQARRAYERSRLEMMRGYAETRDCRRQYLLAYFGEEYPAALCGRCDNDRHRTAVSVPPPVAGPFSVHERVRHPSWGEGVIQRLSGDTLTVLFDHAGYKTLALDLVLEHKLLVSE